MPTSHRSPVLRAALVAVVFNWTAWGAFLLFTPQVSQSEFDEIARKRVASDDARDRLSAGLDLVDDAPTIVAARFGCGFGCGTRSALWLHLMAGPAILASAPQVILERYSYTLPTRKESYVIAAIAFAESTAFWATMGGVVGWIRRRNKQIRER